MEKTKTLNPKSMMAGRDPGRSCLPAKLSARDCSAGLQMGGAGGREGERERDVYVYIYMYIEMKVYTGHIYGLRFP